MEYEITLALPANSHDTLRAWLLTQAHTKHTRTTDLVNVYLDTTHFDLKHQKAAVRLRFDGEQSRWLQTLKTSGTFTDQVHERQEWEVMLPSHLNQKHQQPTLDITLFEQDAQLFLTPYLQELRPVFSTNFTREIYDFIDGETHFEWAFDDGLIFVGDSFQSIQIHELEIELKAGPLDLMRTHAQNAQTALNAKVQSHSKAARGYALIKQA